MEKQDFNPIIEAIVSIRHYATAASNNWTSMKSIGNVLNSDLETATGIVNAYASDDTKHQWSTEFIKYNGERAQLQKIMSYTISKIKLKSADNLSKVWNQYPEYVDKIESIYENLKTLGHKSLPENKKEEWATLWNNIYKAHAKIKNEAEACCIQLKLIEHHNPEEVDKLTDTILKHIPLKYSTQEAHKYTDEYTQAYKAIKKEASQKKNLWDRFLDLLAGGKQQTPAQRVMMQRWVEGEKGDAH